MPLNLTKQQLTDIVHMVIYEESVPLYETHDDRGLEVYEYVEFVEAVLKRIGDRGNAV